MVQSLVQILDCQQELFPQMLKHHLAYRPLLLVHSDAKNAVESLHCRKMFWIMFQERVNHALIGIKGGVEILSEDPGTRSVLPSLLSLFAG